MICISLWLVHACALSCCLHLCVLFPMYGTASLITSTSDERRDEKSPILLLSKKLEETYSMHTRGCARAAVASHITHHTSHITHHTSHIPAHRTSHTAHRTSHMDESRTHHHSIVSSRMASSDQDLRNILVHHLYRHGGVHMHQHAITCIMHIDMRINTSHKQVLASSPLCTDLDAYAPRNSHPPRYASHRDR